MVDAEFQNVHDLYRWFKCGIINIELEKHPAYVCLGVRALMEFDGHGRR